MQLHSAFKNRRLWILFVITFVSGLAFSLLVFYLNRPGA